MYVHKLFARTDTYIHTYNHAHKYTYVCMYVCVYYYRTCTYVCMYVCTITAHVRMYVCMCVLLPHIYMYVHKLFARTDTYILLPHIYMYVHAHRYIHTYTLSRTHTEMLNPDESIYMYVHAHRYIHTYTLSRTHTGMLNPDESERLSLEDVRQHPFLTQPFLHHEDEMLPVVPASILPTALPAIEVCRCIH